MQPIAIHPMGHGPAGFLSNSTRIKKVLDSGGGLFHQADRSQAPIHHNNITGAKVCMEKHHYPIWHSLSYCHG